MTELCIDSEAPTATHEVRNYCSLAPHYPCHHLPTPLSCVATDSCPHGVGKEPETGTVSLLPIPLLTHTKQMPPWPRLRREQGTQVQHHHLRTEARMILQARTSTLDMLQKLLREVPEYLKNVLPSKLPWQPPRQGLHPHHGPWEDLHPLPGVLSGLPLTSRESHRGLQAHTQAPSSPLLPAYLISPDSSLLCPSDHRPSRLAKRTGFLEHSQTQGGTTAIPPASPHNIPHCTQGSQCWRRSKVLLQPQVIRPGRQAEGFTLSCRLYLAPRRISLNPLLYFPSLPSTL